MDVFLSLDGQKSTLCMLLESIQIEELLRKKILSSDVYLHTNADKKVKKFKIRVTLVKGSSVIKGISTRTKGEVLILNENESVLLEINSEQNSVNLFFTSNHAKKVFKSDFFGRKGYSCGCVDLGVAEENHCILHILSKDSKNTIGVNNLMKAFKAVTNLFSPKVIKQKQQKLQTTFV